MNLSILSFMFHSFLSSMILKLNDSECANGLITYNLRARAHTQRAQMCILIECNCVHLEFVCSFAFL